MDIMELQNRVIKFRNARDWEKFHNPKDLSISLALEAGELLELFQWKTSQEVDKIKDDPEIISNIKEELGDILIYTLYLSHSFGFDPSDIIMSKIRINEDRYPIEKAKGTAKKYTQL